MQVFFHVEIIDKVNFNESKPFHKPLLSFLKETFPKVQIYDLDNHSDAVTQHYAKFLCQEASEICAYFHFEQKASLAPLPTTLMRQIITRRQNVQILFNYSAKSLEPYQRLIAPERCHLLSSTEEQKAFLTALYGNS